MTGAAPALTSRRLSNAIFHTSLASLMGVYAVLLLAMLVAMATFTSPADLLRTFESPEIRYATKLSLISCTISAILSLWIAIPAGYVLSRYTFLGKRALDLLFDIPIVLPPLVVGIALLILFQTIPGRWFQDHYVEVTYRVPSVIIAQFAVACAFAIRTMRVTFDQIDNRRENVARTLGCSRAAAFFRVTLPEAWPGVIAAGTLAWARALGEFGPILVFSGATRMRTEVLPTTVFLEMSVGDIGAALAASILMLVAAVVVLGLTRALGMGHPVA